MKKLFEMEEDNGVRGWSVELRVEKRKPSAVAVIDGLGWMMVLMGGWRKIQRQQIIA